MFSIYPPFYYGPQSGLLSWITLIIVIFMHIFCIVEKSCKERSLWSYLYFAYHFSVAFWIILALIVGYAWSTDQSAAPDELWTWFLVFVAVLFLENSEAVDIIKYIMRTAAKKVQGLLYHTPKNYFSGFGTTFFIQRAPTIPISIKTTSYPAHIPPTRKYTTQSKDRTQSSLHPFATCAI